MDHSKTEYWIPKHRYYELKHYCFQYPEWVAAYNRIDSGSKCSGEDPTAENGISLADYGRNIELVERLLKESGKGLYEPLRALVTQGSPIPSNISRTDIWCAYRRFFWRLSMEKGI